MSGKAAPRLITCVLPKDRALGLIEGLQNDLGISAANVTPARSQGLAESVAYGQWSEVDILAVVVDGEQADDAFAYLYDRGNIGQPHGGWITLRALDRRTPFVVPEVAEETVP